MAATKSTATTSTRRKKPTAPKKAAHPLAHRIPDPAIAQEYVHRRIYGVNDFEFLDYARETRKNLLFAGDTGAGKTSLIVAYCSARQIPLVMLNAYDGIDPATFWGAYGPSEDGSSITWTWSEIALAIVHGGFIFIDEVNFMKPRTSAAIHPLLDFRRSVTVLERGNEVLEAHPDLQIGAAYNPVDAGYAGVHDLNAAFKNRWVPVDVEYDADIEGELLCMPITIEIADKLRQSRRDGILETPVSTNMLVAFEEMLADINMEAAIDCFVARFKNDERAAVREVFRLNLQRISTEGKEMVDG